LNFQRKNALTLYKSEMLLLGPSASSLSNQISLRDLLVSPSLGSILRQRLWVVPRDITFNPLSQRMIASLWLMIFKSLFHLPCVWVCII